MASRSLQIGEGLTLPISAMMQSAVVYGTRGSGKSTFGRKIAEEVAKHGQRFCAIDPTGAWWGLKSSESGTDPGLPVVVFGGDHADVPLEPGAGSEVAAIVAEIDQSVILDLELLSKHKQIVFIGAFLERLYHINRDPLLLLMDEAQRYAPQRPMNPDATQTLGAAEDIVKLGRKHGLGSIVFTQRGSGLNKEVSELADLLIAFRTPGVLDQGRIKEWLEANATAEQAKEVMATVSGLPTGTAIFASNHPAMKVFGTISVERPWTYDSSATPEVGQARREPKVLAKPDLDALNERMAGAIERAKAEDPKELRAKVASFDRQLVNATSALLTRTRERDELARQLAERPPETVEVQVPVLSDEDKAVVVAAAESMRELAQQIDSSARSIDAKVQSFTLRHPEPARISPLRPDAQPYTPPPPPSRPSPTQGTVPLRAPRPPLDREVSAPETTGLGKAERSFLVALSQYPDGLARNRLAILTGYKAKSGHIGNTLSKLRTLGLIEKSSDPIIITDFGREAVAGSVEQLPPPGPELVNHWRQRLGKAELAFFDVIVDAYPDALPGPDIAERAGYKRDSGHVGNTLSKLRTMGLIEGGSSAVRATDALVGG